MTAFLLSLQKLPGTANTDADEQKSGFSTLSHDLCVSSSSVAIC